MFRFSTEEQCISSMQHNRDPDKKNGSSNAHCFLTECSYLISQLHYVCSRDSLLTFNLLECVILLNE